MGRLLRETVARLGLKRLSHAAASRKGFGGLVIGKKVGAPTTVILVVFSDKKAARALIEMNGSQ